MVAMAQLDDLTEEIAPVNVPETSDQHPNWRRKHSVSLEELSSSRTFLTVVQAFERERAKNRSAPARRVGFGEIPSQISGESAQRCKGRPNVC
jgi:hypothetical protein